MPGGLQGGHPNPWEPKNRAPVVVGNKEAGFDGSDFFLSHGFPSPCSSGQQERDKVSGLCVLFRGCVCTLQRMFLKPPRCGTSISALRTCRSCSVALTLLTCPFSVPHLVSSPSCCFYGTHLPGCLRPLSML